MLTGGPQTGLACPDNLALDSRGNLIVGCDISSGVLHKGAYQRFGNSHWPPARKWPARTDRLPRPAVVAIRGGFPI